MGAPGQYVEPPGTYVVADHGPCPGCGLPWVYDFTPPGWVGRPCVRQRIIGAGPVVALRCPECGVTITTAAA